MTGIRELFVTRLYEGSIAGAPDFAVFRQELEAACAMLANEDRAGQAWCKTNGYNGYTSYASLDDLPRRATVFGLLKRRLDRHAAIAAQRFDLDLGAGRQCRHRGRTAQSQKHVGRFSVASGFRVGRKNISRALDAARYGSRSGIVLRR